MSITLAVFKDTESVEEAANQTWSQQRSDGPGPLWLWEEERGGPVLYPQARGGLLARFSQ